MRSAVWGQFYQAKKEKKSDAALLWEQNGHRWMQCADKSHQTLNKVKEITHGKNNLFERTEFINMSLRVYQTLLAKFFDLNSDANQTKNYSNLNVTIK